MAEAVPSRIVVSVSGRETRRCRSESAAVNVCTSACVIRCRREAMRFTRRDLRVGRDWYFGNSDQTGLSPWGHWRDGGVITSRTDPASVVSKNSFAGTGVLRQMLFAWSKSRKLVYLHNAVWKNCSYLQLTTHRLNECAERTDIHIGPLFHL
jgi:hypothetical protein